MADANEAETEGKQGSWLFLPLVLVLIWGVGVATYGNSLDGDFLWDDRFLIIDSPYTKDVKYLPQIFTTDFWDLGESADRFRSFYRPVVVSSYLLDHHLWGLESRGFHLTNLVLHLAVSFLVFVVFLRIVEDRWLAAVAAVLFSAHPAHVETVAWISGRTDLFSTLFYLAALLLYLMARDRSSASGRIGLGVASLAVFGLALFSKEMALTLPVLIGFIEFCETEHPFSRAGLPALVKRIVLRTTPFLTLLVVYMMWRGHVLGQMSVNPLQLDALGMLASILHVTTRYLQLLIFPLWLDVHWPDAPLRSFADARAWIGLAVVGAAVAVMVATFRRNREAFFGLGWAWLTIVPVYNIGSFGDVILAERFLYLPSAGFLLAVAIGVRALTQRSSRPLAAATAVVVVLALLLGARTIVRNRIWATEVALFESAVATSPESGYVRSNLGFAYAAEKRFTEAAAEMEKAIEYVPLSALSWSNYGVILEHLDRKEDALEAHRRSVELDPQDSRARFNLGNTLRDQGRPGPAIAAFEAAIELNGNYGLAYTNMGELLIEQGRAADAEQALRSAIEIDRTLAKAHNNLGVLLSKRGRGEEALRSFQAALELEPSSALAARNVGQAAWQLGRTEMAAEAFRLATHLDPNLSPAQLGLAQALVARGETFEAVAVLKLLGERHPGSEKVALLLAEALVAEGRPEEARRVLEAQQQRF